MSTESIVVFVMTAIAVVSVVWLELRSRRSGKAPASAAGDTVAPAEANDRGRRKQQG